MDDRYYLLSETYENIPTGTVIKKSGKKLTNFETHYKYNDVEFIKLSLIEIKKDEASYLVKREIVNRIEDLNGRRMYEKLTNLNKGDTCYLIINNIRCTILKKLKTGDFAYKLLEENGVERKVTVDEIELFENIITQDRKLSTVSKADNYTFYDGVQAPEFVKNMYLSKEFDTTMIKQEAVDDLINKLVYVNDLNPIYGRVRIAFSLSDESLIGIELDPLYLHSNHEQFMHVPLHDNIVFGKSLIVVKRKSIHNFADQLPYKEDSCFVDYSHVKVVVQYESQKHKVDDLVMFPNGKMPTFGIIKKFVILNGIPCVLVVNTPNSSVTTGNYISEEAVTLVNNSDEAHGVSSLNTSSTTIDGFEVYGSSKGGIPDNTRNGRVNDDLPIVPGRKNEATSGNEGISRDNKLSDNLIILDNIKKTCGGIRYLLQTHDTLDTSFNDRIVVSSICCVKRLPQLRDKREIKVGSRVKKINKKGQIYGICRWIGVVSGADVIGVETGRCSDGDADNNTIVYLEGSSTKIELFIAKEISVDYGSEQLKVDDIVRYKTEGRPFYGRIVKIKTVNKVRTVGVVNAINIKDYYPEMTFYKEDEVFKMIVDESTTKCIDNTIIDPRSIVTLSKSSNDQFNIGAEVEFTFKTKKYQGKIHLIVETNRKQSAVIALDVRGAGWISRGIEVSDLCQYRFNQFLSFEDNFNIEGILYVIVKLNALRMLLEKIMRCTNNNVSIFNPLRVETISNATKDNKTIIFKSNATRIIATLRWKGSVNGEECIGCELKHKSDYGTNGKFGQERLFECTDGHGTLIPLDKIEQCCVQPRGLWSRLKSLVIQTHAPLDIIYNDSIVGSTICCVEQLKVLPNNQPLKLGSRVMRKVDKDDIFGICRWIGMINGNEVIGVEMLQCSDGDYDKFVDELALFKCPSNKTALFIARDFDNDSDGLCLCSKNKCIVMDNNNITVVGNGSILNSTIICTINNAIVTKNIKWKGDVNGISCVGYELTRECTCGTNGVFGGKKLFECLPGTGVLIPVNRLFGSCVQDKHKELIMGIDNIIDLDSICCFEPLSRINKWPSMETGSKLKYRSDSSCHRFIGNCKWMGLVNGVESIGANMKQQVYEEIIKKKWIVDIFQCKEGRGALFKADIIEHDIDGERLPVWVDKFVKVTNLWKVKNMNNGDIRGMTVGDYVGTRLNIGEMDQVLNGELKWMGVINNVECVGIDLEDECDYGMNGVIDGKHRFECLPRHGVVTTIANVQKYDDLSLRFTNDGMIDATKYLRCDKKSNKDYLAKANVSKDGLVFVIINNDGRLWKRKGTLKWYGTMNGEWVAVVELDKVYDNGTDGRFWRQQLINCADKKAIAVLWDDVHEYIPYEKKDIPEDKRIFKQIGINSAVLLYMPQGGVVKNFYGTVKWSGVNEFDEYFYGIELDDRYSKGTDGHFLGQELFHCDNNYGILAPVGEVTPDERFIQTDIQESDVPASQISKDEQWCIPVKSWNGENYGIQGNANSCYFDSSTFALFSKSDVLDFLISPSINVKEDNEITKQFRNIMAFNIVYPLREFGFVSFHKTKEMREVIRKYGAKFEEMTQHETDMENVAALLAKLTPSKQLLRLTTFAHAEPHFKNDSMFLQLFVTLSHPETYITSQQMLDISMAQNIIMFEEPPTCLIMQAPRDARGINCYENVLPSRMIEISKLCYHSYKQCHKCSTVATWQCKVCIEETLRVGRGLLCDNHKCNHKEIDSVPDSTKGSKSEIQLQLKAIICIDKAHFVSYVKEDEFRQQWVFFDSMSTQNNANNYSVPKVSVETKVSEFLNKDEVMMEKYYSRYSSSELKRIVKDSYIFVYHNTAKTCY